MWGTDSRMARCPLDQLLTSELQLFRRDHPGLLCPQQVEDFLGILLRKARNLFNQDFLSRVH